MDKTSAVGGRFVIAEKKRTLSVLNRRTVRASCFVYSGRNGAGVDFIKLHTFRKRTENKKTGCRFGIRCSNVDNSRIKALRNT